MTGVAVGVARGVLHRWLTEGATADLGDLIDEAFTTLASLVDEASLQA